MRVIASDLESRRFGVAFARLDHASPGDLADALARSDADGVAIISARIDTTDLPLVRDLEGHGFRIMDTLVYHRAPLPFAAPAAATPGPSQRIETLTGNDAAACAALARRAFHGYMGRYHADPRLSDAAADEAYADWIARLLTDPPDGQFALGLRDETGLAGFIAGQRAGSGISEIVLNAVDPDRQRSGIYAALLHASLALASGRGDREMVISTQLQNYPVQRAWSRAGFTLYRSFHTLHRWAPGA